MATILLADDDPDILGLVTVQLERAGHGVIVARDGDEALRLAASEAPDLCILDVSMPGLDGFEVTKGLRADTGSPRIPVILLSARAEPSERAFGAAAGADAYIAKPFSARILRERVDALLGRDAT